MDEQKNCTNDSTSIFSGSSESSSYVLLPSPTLAPQRKTSLESDQIVAAMEDAANANDDMMTTIELEDSNAEWDFDVDHTPDQSASESDTPLDNTGQLENRSITSEDEYDGPKTPLEATPSVFPPPNQTTSTEQSTPPESTNPEQAYTVFHGVTFLGSAVVNAPRSEPEIKRNMSILNDHNSMAIPVRLLIPNNADGLVRAVEPSANTDIASYKLHRILFCARGTVTSSERNCFAFTCSHGDSSSQSLFQCHVFRCDLSDAVGKIMYCFNQSFKSLSKKSSSPPLSPVYEDSLYTFDVTLEIREDDGRGSFTSCPQDSGMFKLRLNVRKYVTVTLFQTSNREVKIERCFGMLLCPGRNIKNSDMHLIEMLTMGYDTGSSSKAYTVSAEWNPMEDNFSLLNEETPKEMRVFMTVAVDLVFAGIRQPVRFVIETKARIYPRNERFWYFSKKQIKEKFFMHLKPASGSPSGELDYELENLVSETARERMKSVSLHYASARRSIPSASTTDDAVSDDDSDDESPMVSGSGHVSKEIDDSHVDLLTQWGDLLKKWHSDLSTRPKQVEALCRKGIPEALRGEVWQRLSGSHHSDDLIEAYRILITKDAPCEETIVKDLNRTYPAHDFFAKQGGAGQDSLLRLNKAYSVYDSEVDYCQGMSFIGAALLLHMPEEQAFAVLVKIMFDYKLRHLYKDRFDDLHMRFYQLEMLLLKLMPDLYEHLREMEIEAHMFASQWFLTLFTAKFPLYLVYRVLDIFLCNGINTIFNIAIALLKDSRRELLALDFEGVLKFFRVSLPKKYRSEQASQQLLDIALKIKISAAKLKKYEKEYLAMKAAEVQQENPLTRLERENKTLMHTNMRLEQENDGLAHEMVMSKVALRNDLDSAEDSVEALMRRLEISLRQISDLEDENKRLLAENNYLKEKYRLDIVSVEGENKRNAEIIQEYKTICSQLSVRLEKTSTSSREELETYQGLVKRCLACSAGLKEIGLSNPANEKQDPQEVNKEKKIRELELELARTKLELVETQCQGQEMSHQVTALSSELQSAKNNWFTKGLTSIKEAVNKQQINSSRTAANPAAANPKRAADTT